MNKQTMPKRKLNISERLKIVYVPVHKLKMWEKNPRDNDVAAENLAKLIGEHGFIGVIVATPDNVVRAGHTKLKAAILKGMKKVPVIYKKFASEADAIKYSLSDNKASEWAKYNEELLVELFGELQELDIDTDGTGYTQLEIRELAQSSTRKNLDQAIRDFEESDPGAMPEQWVWIAVAEDKEVYQALLKRYGKDITDETKKRSTRRELDWKKVKRRLL